jgi:hypothetical protein
MSTFALEYVYFLSVFQCEFLPQPALCESLRDAYRLLGRLPTREEFVLFLYHPCDPCDYDTPFDMWVTLTDHIIQQFGLRPTCYLLHCCYQAYLTHDRLPTLVEFFDEVEQRGEVPPDVVNEWMARDTDEMWARRRAHVPLEVAPVQLASRDDTCCLCLDAVTSAHPVRTLACGHTFHSNVWVAGTDLAPPADCEGIEMWFERCASCPLCKRDVGAGDDVD